MWKLVTVGLMLLLAACTNPSDGPKISDMQNASLPDSDKPFPVLSLSEVPGEHLRGETGPGLSLFNTGELASTRLRPGDTISVMILDRGEEGLLSAADSKTLELGQFCVDRSGFVTLPFVGRQRVLGVTPEVLQDRIVNDLRGSAVDPQAVVTVVEQPSSEVTVNGAVNSAGRYPLKGAGERVLDAVALAGGASTTPGSSKVTLIRDSRRGHARLSRIMNEESQNIFLRPGDQIVVDEDAASFMALGAVKSAGEFEFEPNNLTLAQAVSRAGGLLDDRADAQNVYVIRPQGALVSSATAARNQTADATLSRVGDGPAIYHVDMRDVSNFVLMQRFQMQDGDMLYATNADMVDFAKPFNIFQKSAPTAAAPQPGS